MVRLYNNEVYVGGQVEIYPETVSTRLSKKWLKALHRAAEQAEQRPSVWMREQLKKLLGEYL